MERQFERYYSKLKVQLRGLSKFDHGCPDNELLTNMVNSAKDGLWENPEPSVPLATAHLRRQLPSGEQGLDDLASLEHLNCKQQSIVAVLS